MTFYVVITVVSVVSFTVDMVLRYMEKIRSFGMEEPLHRIKGSTIPIEDLIPYNITMLTVFGMMSGTVGILTELLGLHPFIGFPVSIASGCTVNFIIMHFIKPFYLKVSGDVLSEDTDISGYDGVCTAFVGGDDYGRVKVVYNGKNYEFDAISENETDIDVGEPIVVLYREDGVCVVEKQSEVLNIINEEP